MKRIVVGLVSIFVVCFCSHICIGNEMQAVEHDQKDQTEKTKRVVKKVGPFEIGKKRFVVIEDVIERAGNVISCNSFEIKDDAGTSFYRKELGPSEDSSTVIEGIFKLEGKSGEGLILYFDLAPNAPPAGTSFQIFGVVKGKLKLLSEPINVYGQIESSPKGKSEGSKKLFDGDVINVEIWKDFFGVFVPLAVDLKKLTITPLIKEGIFNISTTPGQPHTSFEIPVKLYENHDVNANKEIIAAKEVKKVEFFKAHASVQLENQNSDSPLNIYVSNLWLKVRVNGKEGWVNDLEDFFTLGLIP